MDSMKKRFTAVAKFCIWRRCKRSSSVKRLISGVVFVDGMARKLHIRESHSELRVFLPRGFRWQSNSGKVTGSPELGCPNLFMGDFHTRGSVNLPIPFQRLSICCLDSLPPISARPRCNQSSLSVNQVVDGLYRLITQSVQRTRIGTGGWQ